LAPGCTYTLSVANNSSDLGANGLPVITARITITGAHATIARSSAQKFRIVEVDGPGGNLTLNGVTLAGGDTPGPGGGAFNLAGVLTLNDSAVTGNASEGGMMSAGGGIASGTLGNGPVGTLVLNASQVTGNTTSGDAGGILNHAGIAVLNASRVSGNTSGSGGGIANVNFGIPPSGGSGVLTIKGSKVSGNSASGFGGGLANATDSTATIIGSSVTGNSTSGSGGGIANQGDLTMTGSRVLHNTAAVGGGIANLGGTVTLTGTRVAGNIPDNCEPPGTITGCVG
jgi:hypothetical protein